MSTCNCHAATTSCHIHQGQAVNLYHSGTKVLQTTPTGIKSTKHFFNTKPKNPAVGDLYMNTSNSELSIWDGGAWILVDPGSQENIIDQFDIVTDDEGFFKVKLYKHSETDKKSVMIWDGDDLFIDDTEKSIDFLKRNLKDKYYLWVEKRILNHLS